MESQSIQTVLNIRPKCMKMVTNIDPGATVDFGLQKRYENGSHMELKGIQNQLKIASKIKAKNVAEKASENDAKRNNNDATMFKKQIPTNAFSRNCDLAKTLLLS